MLCVCQFKAPEAPGPNKCFLVLVDSNARRRSNKRRFAREVSPHWMSPHQVVFHHLFCVIFKVHFDESHGVQFILAGTVEKIVDHLVVKLEQPFFPLSGRRLVLVQGFVKKVNYVQALSPAMSKMHRVQCDLASNSRQVTFKVSHNLVSQEESTVFHLQSDSIGNASCYEGYEAAAIWFTCFSPLTEEGRYGPMHWGFAFEVSGVECWCYLQNVKPQRSNCPCYQSVEFVLFGLDVADRFVISALMHAQPSDPFHHRVFCWHGCVDAWCCTVAKVSIFLPLKKTIHDICVACHPAYQRNKEALRKICNDRLWVMLGLFMVVVRWFPFFVVCLSCRRRCLFWADIRVVQLRVLLPTLGLFHLVITKVGIFGLVWSSIFAWVTVCRKCNGVVWQVMAFALTTQTEIEGTIPFLFVFNSESVIFLFSVIKLLGHVVSCVQSWHVVAPHTRQCSLSQNWRQTRRFFSIQRCQIHWSHSRCLAIICVAKHVDSIHHASDSTHSDALGSRNIHHVSKEFFGSHFVFHHRWYEVWIVGEKNVPAKVIPVFPFYADGVPQWYPWFWYVVCCQIFWIFSQQSSKSHEISFRFCHLFGVI